MSPLLSALLAVSYAGAFYVGAYYLKMFYGPVVADAIDAVLVCAGSGAMMIYMAKEKWETHKV